jgi:hypothetical protein
MDFTFGIITGGGSNHRESKFWGDSHTLGDPDDVGLRINHIIGTIEDQNIPNYEVVVVGGDNYYEDSENINYIPFDENIKWAWITKKKNLITSNAKYENVVYMHDYIALEENWYDGYLDYGDDWDVCMNVINNIEGYRWLDLLLRHESGYHVMAPYDYIESHRDELYVSGAYWVSKKKFMEEFPLNEELSWGTPPGEDIEWTDRWISNHNYKFKMNTISSSRVCKEHKLYSAPHLFRSGAEKGFKTKDVNKMLQWYGSDKTPAPDAYNPPWLFDDMEGA